MTCAVPLVSVRVGVGSSYRPALGRFSRLHRKGLDGGFTRDRVRTAGPSAEMDEEPVGTAAWTAPPPVSAAPAAS